MEEKIIPDLSEIEEERDYTLNFTTSSAISRVNIKFLSVYIPIFWFGGLGVCIFWYEYTRFVTNWIPTLMFLPLAFFGMYFVLILGCLLISKFMLILVNLIHKPREGIFKAEIGDSDFEFWCLRIELKKLVMWLIRNCPFPWVDSLAFRWFGIKMDFSSHLNDTWCDIEFVKMGRKVTIGQGAVVMSSMVVGNYLIIKEVVLDDYALVGGQSTIAPGTFFSKDTMLGAVSVTLYNQVLEEGWIYSGIPARKLKPNRYAETREEVIYKVDVESEQRFEKEHEINIDKDKKDLAIVNGGKD